ncbi:MAG: EAL domain-containing protein [Actinomycetia bacterium]|nr:EAL domain-containing protein [Actinomycetes bacterium]
MRTLLRDLAAHDSADQGIQLQLCSIMWWLRHTVLVVASLGVVQGGVGETGALVIIAALVDLCSHLATQAIPRLIPHVTLLDGVALITLAILGLPPLIVLLIGVASLGWAASLRPIPAITTYLAVTGAAIASLTREDASVSTGQTLTVFVLLGMIFMMRSIRLNMAARRTSDKQRQIALGVDAVLWEEVPSRSGELSALKVSPAAERMLGYAVDQWLEPGFWTSIVHPDDLARVLAEVKASYHAQSDHTSTFRLLRKDGTWMTAESRISSARDRQDRHLLFVGIITDRTRELQASAEADRFSHLVATSPVGQFLVVRNERGLCIDAANAACRDLFPGSEDPTGRCVPILVAERPELAVLNRLLMGADDQPARGEILGESGTIYQATVRRLEVGSYTVDVLDITERVEAAQKLEELARIDSLTGLPNRRAFVETLDRTIVAGREQNTSTAILMIDLDDFKEVNDALGHEIGDQLLCSIAERLESVAGDHDFVARLGGDEFALVLTDTRVDDARWRAQHLGDQIREPVMHDGLRLRVRASVGIAMHPTDADGAIELMRQADVAMFQAKTGRLGHHVYDATADPFGRERLQLVNQLETAIETGGLVLHHQPLVDGLSGEVAGTEALIRWNHPELGLVPPLRFIELAEVSGQMKALTRWVIDQALSEIAALGAQGAHLILSCNLSVRNLYEGDLVAWVGDALSRHRVAPERLAVEITETMIMDDQEAATEVLGGLRAIGVKVWIDDFGTGHSSFARLRTLPVDGVKIDQSFVADVAVRESDQVVLRNLIELVHALGLNVIVEGIECAVSSGLARGYGANLLQGYHHARPAPIAELGLPGQAATVSPLDVELSVVGGG